MSLINDALKRAKIAQQQTPPPAPDHLPLREVDPQVAVTHGIGLAMPVAFAVVALLLLFFAWRFYMDKGPGARTSLTAAASTQREAAPIARPVSAAPPVTAPEPAPVPAPAPVQPPAPDPAPKPATEPPKPAAEPAAPPATNATAVTEPPAPKPPPLMLQGIVYNRTRPSALINGKTLFIGERIREFRVVAIRQDSATLVGGGQTNVLTLPE